MDGDAWLAGALTCGVMWTIYDDINAFYLEHRRCGELDGGVEGEQVWMACSCSARIMRPVGSSPLVA